MQSKFFHIPVKSNGAQEEDLNEFLRSQKISCVTDKFVDDKQNSFWAIKVDYVHGALSRGKNKARVDYREVLGEEEFASFSRLRELRKSLAETEGIPVYAVCTNEQLAAIVKGNVQTMEQFISIDGIGEQKAAKYGERFLSALRQGKANTF